MKVKLFFEPKGKAREQIQLESCIPFELGQFRRWMTSWISNKDLKKWSKEKWNERVLGEFRPGKIFEAVEMEQSETLKGDLIAYRSYIPDNTGAKKKLPMILVGRLKNVLNFENFKDKMNLGPEEEKEIRDSLKNDVWAPISIFQAQTVDRKYVVDIDDTLTQAVEYLIALYSRNPESVGYPVFIETEVFKT